MRCFNNLITRTAGVPALRFGARYLVRCLGACRRSSTEKKGALVLSESDITKLMSDMRVKISRTFGIAVSEMVVLRPRTLQKTSRFVLLFSFSFFDH